MSTTTEQIVSAIVALISGATPAAGRVRADMPSAEPFEDAPCIIIEVGDETSDYGRTIGVCSWTLSLTFAIYAEGAVPKLAPEATRAQLHSLLMANRTLGGLVFDLAPAAITRETDDENPALGITRCAYQVQYRVADGST